MIRTTLTLGPLQANGFAINRSGIQWLCEDGHICRANEVIGYCNVSIVPTGRLRGGQAPFADERELQVAFAPRIAGRIHIAAETSLGGHLNALGVYAWESGAVVGSLEPVDGGAGQGLAEAGVLRLLLAGRRMTGLADVLTGLLPGWHSRARAWWGESADEPKTMISLGICDAIGPVRGDQSAFLEMFEGAVEPAHIVFVPNHPVSPCAPCLIDQFTRSPTEFQAISADITRAISSGSISATAHDWLFVGALLAALDRSPMHDTYDLLTSNGMCKGGRATSVLLSLNAEDTSILQHKTLGYRLHIMRHLQYSAGPAIRAWLSSAFDTVHRTIDDIKRDYIELIDTVGAETNARFLILNRMSTSGREDISTYAPFEAPMSDTLANIASKELNLMLHDIAEERDLAIIDVDAIAAEVGGSDHLPDGVHQSGLMQAEVRAEILHALNLKAA